MESSTDTPPAQILPLNSRRRQSSAARLADSQHSGPRFCGALRLLARGLGYSTMEAEELEDAASWHDIGKQALPAALLDRPGALRPEEWKQMTWHTVLGAKLLLAAALGDASLAADIALSHHERWDGSGYPLGLEGTEIPLAARLVAIVDSYDALCSPRPYRESLSHREACEILLHGDGRTRPEHFDPELLALFRAISWELELYDGLVRMEESGLRRRAS